ncbi:MAG: amidohydrolase [Bryobacteraceae bacterium]|nr:amidohydrolase [Bryobacteraceae bacterium]
MIDRISMEVWNLAELSIEEHQSAQVHIRELEAAGFQVAKGASGCKTAFIAEWSQGKGGPKIGFLPEYDALPGLNNAAVSEPQSFGSNTNGHGCGHNLLGAGCTGAAIALKKLMEREKLPGTLRVYGCAAEELRGVKVFMARDGLFNDLDAALAWHPAPFAGAGDVRTAASNQMTIEFFGRTAHAGVAPWEGRSALHAAELFAHSLNLMREHVEPTARIQYIFEAAGEATNVVCEYSRVLLVIRDQDRRRVEAHVDWARQAAQGAAMATQTRAEFKVLFGMWDLLPNSPLIESVHANLQRFGVVEWTEEEQAFARICQKRYKVPEVGLTGKIQLIMGAKTGGATDVGDVSWITPSTVFAVPSMPAGLPMHSWVTTACSGMSIGLKSAVAASAVLTATGYQLLTDPALVAAARADLVKRKGSIEYVAPFPPETTYEMASARSGFRNDANDQPF